MYMFVLFTEAMGKTTNFHWDWRETTYKPFKLFENFVTHCKAGVTQFLILMLVVVVPVFVLVLVVMVVVAAVVVV